MRCERAKTAMTVMLSLLLNTAVALAHEGHEHTNSVGGAMAPVQRSSFLEHIGGTDTIMLGGFIVLTALVVIALIYIFAWARA